MVVLVLLAALGAYLVSQMGQDPSGAGHAREHRHADGAAHERAVAEQQPVHHQRAEQHHPQQRAVDHRLTQQHGADDEHAEQHGADDQRPLDRARRRRPEASPAVTRPWRGSWRRTSPT